MKKYLALTLIVLCGFSGALAQSKSNQAINRQIKDLKAEKAIALTYDEAAKTSKIMVTAENFEREEAKRAGVEAMNFGMAFFYPGNILAEAPAEFNFTFWVLSKKPRFAAAHRWTATVGEETLDLGDARYAARAAENMEYLNFKISRSNLEKIAKAREVKFKIGAAEMSFTAEHLRTFANLLKISDPAG